MSLKAFHIIFVTVSILLSIAFGVWSIVEYRDLREWSYLVMGIGSFITVIALLIYGKYVLKKLKHISYL